MQKRVFRFLLVATVFTVLSSSAHSDYSIEDLTHLEGLELAAKVWSVPFLKKDKERHSREYLNFSEAVDIFYGSYRDYRLLKAKCDGHNDLDVFKDIAADVHTTIFISNDWDVRHLDTFKDKVWDAVISQPISHIFKPEIARFNMMSESEFNTECATEILPKADSLVKRQLNYLKRIKERDAIAAVKSETERDF